jgi:hypothetical protein
MSHRHRAPQRTTLALAITLALGGCGGGGGGSDPVVTPPSGGGNPPPPVSTTTITGVVTDGYVSGATVYLDLNNNNVRDANEPGAVTDATGRFSLTASATVAQVNGQHLRMSGGTDLSTGQPFTHSMSALIDDAASKPFVPVSPFGTMIDGMLASGAATSQAQARELAARVFGLSSAAVFDKDPLSVVSSEPALLQKMVALQKSIEVLAMSDKTAAETGTAAALARAASALGAEIVRQAGTLVAGAALPSVGSLVTGAVTNQDRFFTNRPAAHGTVALAADVATVTEATLAVAVSQLLQVAPDATGAALQSALATYVDARLKVIEPLQDSAVARAAQITQAPTGDPLRLSVVARDAGASAQLVALVNASAGITSVPTAARATPAGLDGVRGAVDQLPTGLPTTAPTPAPTVAPTQAPTPAPTSAPTPAPTAAPTSAPTPAPTQAPTTAPTPAPTVAPTPAPTPAPSQAPTVPPTAAPTAAPTPAPTQAPTPAPTAAPTQAPTPAPTAAPTAPPTPAPTLPPTTFPGT